MSDGRQRWDCSSASTATTRAWAGSASRSIAPSRCRMPRLAWLLALIRQLRLPPDPRDTIPIALVESRVHMAGHSIPNSWGAFSARVGFPPGR